MNSVTKIQLSSDTHLKMTQLSNEVMKIVTEINTKYKTNSGLRDLISKLIGEVDRIWFISPFFTDCPQNIHLGKEVYINLGFKFQVKGGIYKGDKCLIGHNTVIATINHNISPRPKRDLISSRVNIGNNVWIGSGSKYNSSRSINWR